MSAHYSKFGLNTYYGTPYFQAQLPTGYPLHLTLQKCRAFRRLPPHLRELAGKAKAWAIKAYPGTRPWFIEQWYDDDGNELDPDTGRRLSDEEIDAEWDMMGNLGLGDFQVQDIPVPDGGFADPDTWEPPPVVEDEDDEDGIKPERVAESVRQRGEEYVAKEYGMSVDEVRAIVAQAGGGNAS